MRGGVRILAWSADYGTSAVSVTPNCILVVEVCALSILEKSLGFQQVSLRKYAFFFHVFEDRISHKGHSFKTFCFEVIKARLRKGSKAPDLGSPLTLEPGNVISPAIPFTYYTCCFLGLQ